MDTPASLYTDVTSRILEVAIEVHRVLGPGFLESVYEEALAHEFDLHFLVEDAVIVELKAVKDFDEIHSAQVMSYHKATGKRVGLLINFAKPRLIDGVKRIQK